MTETERLMEALRLLNQAKVVVPRQLSNPTAEAEMDDFDLDLLIGKLSRAIAVLEADGG